MMRDVNRRWTFAGLATLALLTVVPITGAVTRNAAEAAVAQPGDGTTSASAGASCWGVKQQYPASQTGRYWVLTGSMDRPAEVACDMTTDGGGWALVGRGRNGWTFNPNGQGSPANVVGTPDGTAAFGPAALSTDAITGLLDGAPVNSLADGVRIERATSSNGASRQDVRLHFVSQRWTWNLDAGQLLTKVVINGTTYNGSNTKDTAASTYGQTTNALAGIQDTRRLSTAPLKAQGYSKGFALGTGIGGGSSSSDNYLWTKSGSTAPQAFAKVWVRPRIANDATGFTPIPAAGFPVENKPAGLKDRSELAPWGVEGYNHDGEGRMDPWNDNVMVVKVYGDRVYVGGRFRTVKQGPTGPEYPQQSLAAFDLDGNWISTFRPNVAGRVWDMTMTDDGKLIVGGDFSSIDGAPDTSAMAALDPITGAVNPNWIGSATRTSGEPLVRSLDAQGDFVYAAGRFNRFKGGASAAITTTNAISLKASNGGPGTWRPKIYASAISLRVANAGDRVYMAGYFNAVNGDTNHGYYGITNIADGSVVPNIGPFRPSSPNAKYQQAVAESGDNILVGGSEHDIQLYDHDRNTLLESHITKAGGDTQALETIGDYVYASCHCMNWIYQGTNTWPTPTNFRSIDPIRAIGRFDAATMEYDTSWFPDGTKGTNDAGIWSIAADRRDCLWVGGDLIRGGYSGNAARDYLGGFARFCPTDAEAPTAPGNFQATVGTGSVNLSWNASTDDSGSVAYDVYRDDRVIATVYGTSYADDAADSATTHTYTVRASDARGNRSASPAPVAVNGPAPELGTPIPSGSVWSYADTGTDLGTAWRTGSTDGWASGPGPLGWNGSYATDIGPTRPITTYFRRDFTIADPTAVKLLDIGSTFTQGAVLYVNGVEVGRTNMPNGAIGYNTVANQYVGGAEDLRTKSFAVPGSLLRAGTNTMAVEVHGWRANAGKVFFDLAATSRGASADTEAPSAPVLTATPAAGDVALSWTTSTDDTALSGYVVSRDGAPLAVVAPSSNGTTDAAVDTTVDHTYSVSAFDAAGNTRASADVLVATVANPNVLGFGSTWSWRYEAAAPADGWQTDGFDATGWASGAGELGFGGGQATIITTQPSPRPLASYYRRSVTVADPAAFASYGIDLIGNAGAVVYVNGVEVARSNMPAGPIGPNSYALSTPKSADRHTPVRLTIPNSVLRAGENTVAVEVHNNYRSATSMGFDLALVGLP